MRARLHTLCLVGLLAAGTGGAGQLGATDSVQERVRLAGLYREQGQYHLADEVLQAVDAAQLAGNTERAAWQREMALVQRATGQAELARETAESALAAARRSGSGAMEAVIHVDLGLMAVDAGDLEGAADLFEQAYRQAGGDAEVAATAALNRARLGLRTGDFRAVEDSLEAAERQLDTFTDPEREANARLGLGAIYRDAQKRLGLPANWRLQAFEQFRMAGQLASAANDRRLESWALGYTGGLYEDELRYVESLDLSRRAAFLAQAANDDDALYRWQWQTARALRAQGDVENAIVAYRQSIATLNRLKPDLGHGPGPGFRQRAAPVFFDYADMLLSRTATLADAKAVERNLREIRTTLEQVKVAEVQDYFQDRCVAADDGDIELEVIGGTAAIIYPILLPDRTELLVSLPGGLRQFTSPVSSRQLTDEVRQFRQRIETYDGRTGYMRYAQRLYRWLLGPVEDALVEAAVDTLVIVPDGPLRTIPLSALHDGRNFLIERWAVATTPGLTLTSPRPLQTDRVQLLAGGLTEAVQGFSALPNVAAELESISRAFPSRTIQNEEFLVDEMQRQIAEGDQAIVHIATHGQFDSDHTKSFLLAYDDKLTMDRLQSTISSRQYQEEPLELLVLSACQTAAGDDRAALGLAGVALKAGARSALATLWFVNDESTARMVGDFYTHLGEPGNSKARALQQAQLALIGDRRFSHPSYWAPFLLIGNWL